MRANWGLVAILLAAVGCAPQNSVEGTWMMLGTPSVPPGSKCFATFTKPDRMSLTFDISRFFSSPDKPNGQEMTIHYEVVGTYRVEGQDLVVHADNVKFEAQNVPWLTPDQLDKATRDSRRMLEQEINSYPKLKMEWVSKDEFKVTGQSGQAVTYTRM
ncbi:MAG: hypothetical protein JSS66_02415 [Armatimonadetes bacterium]|nr:hypothetical protein [Armatimonadota bacterium]